MAASLHDAYASEYDQQVCAYGCYLAEALFGLSYEHIQPGQTLLDLGIGTGLSAQLFAKAGLQVHGADFSPAMLELCRQKGIAADLKLLDLAQPPWPYSTAGFDHIVCCGVFHFIPDLEAIFAEASRVIQSGGIFALTTKTPGQDCSPEPYEHQASGEMEVFAHTPAYLERLFAQTGFERLKLLRAFVGTDCFDLWTLLKKGDAHEPNDPA